MTDLKDPRLIYLKGFLFLLGGILAAGLLILDHPTLTGAFLLAVTVWCFCRFYYFAFYVIEHYVDPNYKFAGLWAFARYLLQRRQEEGLSSQVTPASSAPPPPPPPVEPSPPESPGPVPPPPVPPG